RNGYHPALFTVDDGNWSTPESLARDTPIANAISDRRRTEALSLGVFRHLPDCVLRKLTAPIAAIDQHSILREGLGHDGRLIAARNGSRLRLFLFMSDGRDDLSYRQRVLLREFE